MSTYIVTFRLGCEVVTSRHKTLNSARKALRKSLATKSRYKRFRIYRAVGLEKRARVVADPKRDDGDHPDRPN